MTRGAVTSTGGKAVLEPAVGVCSGAGVAEGAGAGDAAGAGVCAGDGLAAGVGACAKAGSRLSRANAAAPQAAAATDREEKSDMVPFQFRRPQYFLSGVLPDACRRLATDRFYRIPDKACAKGARSSGVHRRWNQEAGGALGWKAVPADFRWTNSASVVR